MKKNQFIYCVVLMLFSLFATITTANSTERVVMGSNDPIDSTNGRFYNALYSEAFRRLGVEFEYRFLPAKRASFMADRGQIDGELARIEAYGNSHPNLIRVEESALDDSFSAYAIDSSIRLKGWESLRGKSYRIGYLSGVFKVEQQLNTMLLGANLFPIEKITQGLQLVASGRTDLYIDSSKAVEGLLTSSEFQGTGIVNVGTMEKTEYFAYFHTSKKQLALDLADELRKMKSEGLVAQIRQDTFY